MFCCPLIRQLLNTFCLKYDRFWDETIFEKLLNLVFVWQNVPPSSRFSATGKMVIISWCIVLQTETVEVELMNWIFICYSWSMRTSIMKRNMFSYLRARGVFQPNIYRHVAMNLLSFVETYSWEWTQLCGEHFSMSVYHKFILNEPNFKINKFFLLENVVEFTSVYN